MDNFNDSSLANTNHHRLSNPIDPLLWLNTSRLNGSWDLFKSKVTETCSKSAPNTN